MEKARQLVKDSRTTNMPVTVWTFMTSPGKAVGSYLVRLLKDLGYRASLHAVPVDQFFDTARQLPQQDQMGSWRMGRRLPRPIDFLPPCLELPLG